MTPAAQITARPKEHWQRRQDFFFMVWVLQARIARTAWTPWVKCQYLPKIQSSTTESWPGLKLQSAQFPPLLPLLQLRCWWGVLYLDRALVFKVWQVHSFALPFAPCLFLQVILLLDCFLVPTPTLDLDSSYHCLQFWKQRIHNSIRKNWERMKDMIVNSMWSTASLVLHL